MDNGKLWRQITDHVVVAHRQPLGNGSDDGGRVGPRANGLREVSSERFPSPMWD